MTNGQKTSRKYEDTELEIPFKFKVKIKQNEDV